VFVPTLFDKQMPRESNQPTALENGTITSTLRYTKVLNNNSKAIEWSKKRISESPDAKKLQDLDNRINALYDNVLPTIPLQFSKVFDEVSRINAIWKEIQAVNETEYAITVERNSTDVEYQQFDDYVKPTIKKKFKQSKATFISLKPSTLLTI